MYLIIVLINTNKISAKTGVTTDLNSIKIQNLLKDFSFNKKRGKLLIYPLNENKKENIKNKC